MKKLLSGLLLLVLLSVALPSLAETMEEVPVSVTLTIGEATFTVLPEQNDTAEAFLATLPVELAMRELNANEKYCYLDNDLPAAAEVVGQIEAGDLMLYGNSCIVLFYKSFPTSYTYTRIGHIEAMEGLAEALGKGSVTVSFAVAEDLTVVDDAD